jgi:hypothetical protein
VGRDIVLCGHHSGGIGCGGIVSTNTGRPMMTIKDVEFWEIVVVNIGWLSFMTGIVRFSKKAKNKNIRKL